MTGVSQAHSRLWSVCPDQTSEKMPRREGGGLASRPHGERGSVQERDNTSSHFTVLDQISIGFGSFVRAEMKEGTSVHNGLRTVSRDSRGSPCSLCWPWRIQCFQSTQVQGESSSLPLLNHLPCQVGGQKGLMWKSLPWAG